jgi:hypothetical protein
MIPGRSLSPFRLQKKDWHFGASTSQSAMKALPACRNKEAPEWSCLFPLCRWAMAQDQAEYPLLVFFATVYRIRHRP